MKASKFLTVLGSLFFSFIASSQLGDMAYREKFIEAESYFQYEEYLEALPLYQQLLSNDGENNNLKYRIGLCYLNNIYLKEKSIQFLQTASENMDPSYKEGNYRELSAPYEALFYLAEACRVNDLLDAAIHHYQKYLELVDGKVRKEIDEEIVQQSISSCKLAIKQKTDPVNSVRFTFDELFNSRYEESHPVMSGDGKTVAFTRKLKFYDAIMISEKGDDGKWSSPRNIIPELGIDGGVMTSALNYEGNILYLYNNDSYDGNIYQAVRERGRWNPIEKLNKNINSKYWESNASVSQDGLTMYFASNRPGGYGELDIYKSEMGPFGEWQEPENLGEMINTPYNDEAAFVTSDGEMLFFSSNGHSNSIGGYDIFYSELESATKTWRKPKNMGYPINTPWDELFASPIMKGDTMLMSLNIKDTTQLKDIFAVTVPHVQSVSKAEKAQFALDSFKILVKQAFKDEVTSEEANSIKNYAARDYKYSFEEMKILAEEYVYTDVNVTDELTFDLFDQFESYVAGDQVLDSNDVRLLDRLIYGNKKVEFVDRKEADFLFTVNDQVSGKDNDEGWGKLFVETMVNHVLKDESTPDQLAEGESFWLVNRIEKDGKNDKLEQDLMFLLHERVNSSLTASKFVKTFEITPIYFAFNDYKLNSDAKKTLQGLYQLLKDYPVVKLELKGHSDAIGDAGLNKTISELRALSVRDYLLHMGLSIDRFQVFSYGEDEAVGINSNPDGSDNPEGRKYNRRVEINVINYQTNLNVVKKINIPPHLRAK